MEKNFMDEFEWFDGWCEHHYFLMEKENYPELVEHCRKRAERDPKDVHAIEALAEALVLNEQYQESIEMLTPRYIKDPDHPLYAHAILDALFGMGKTADDYNWKSKPKILEISNYVLDLCFDYLKPKRKPRSISDLFVMLMMADGYVHFTEDELLQALTADARFNVNCDNSYEADISIVRKQKRKAQQ